jgi:hypothetical protein
MNENTVMVKEHKGSTFKGVMLGIVLTLVVEAGIFVYQTCGMQVTTKYIYNPSNIVNMLPTASEAVVTR